MRTSKAARLLALEYAKLYFILNLEFNSHFQMLDSVL